MILNDYNKIINENFDLMDTDTRKCIVALESAEQSQILSALASALYDKIVEKVDDIDFGTIPRSRGDITKVDGYKNTYECLRIIRRLVEEYHQDPTVVENVIGAVENIKERKAVFMKAYALNIEFPVTLYNLMVAAIENSVSFLISVCIQYIKDPETGDIATAIDKTAYHNVKDNMLYEQLLGFNTSCADGTLDKSLDYIIKNGRKLQEAAQAECGFCRCQPRGPFEDPKDVPDPMAVPLHEEEPTEPTGLEIEPGFAPSLDNATADDYELDRRDIANEALGAAITAGLGLAAKGIGVVALGASAIAATMTILKAIISVIIPFMRNTAYYLISGYAKIGANLEVQADFIEMNAYKLQTSDDYASNPKEMQKVVTKQKKVAEKLKKWANKFAIDNKKADVKAREMLKKEGKNKVKIADLEDEIPSNVYNKSLLF